MIDTLAPTAAVDAGTHVAVSLLGLPGPCWRCGQNTVPLVGVLLPTSRGQRFVEFSDVAARLAATVCPSDLATLGIGPIKIRRSRLRPAGYLANGCVHCDAILGEHPLREDLITFLAEGGSLRELVVATLGLPRRERVRTGGRAARPTPTRACR